MAVDGAGLLPLGGKELLRLGADDAGDDCRQRQGNEGNQAQLPGHNEHHDADADDSQHRLHQLRERLLQRGLDVVDVVGHAGHQVPALAGVKVPQRAAG